MLYSLKFENLPFKPEKNQVIYVENIFDRFANHYIMVNYDKLLNGFEEVGLEFIYLPLYFNDAELKKQILYYAPYLYTKFKEYNRFRNDFLLDFMLNEEKRTEVVPSLLFTPQQNGDEWSFKALPFASVADEKTDVSAVVTAVKREYDSIDSDDNYDVIFYNEGSSLTVEVCEPSLQYGSYCGEPGKGYRKAYRDGLLGHDDDICDIFDDLQAIVENLRLRGVALGVIHEFIDKQEPLSPLVITEDLRIFLPLYNNIEIVMSAQKKALYFLFLNHPEGIVLQHLEKYHTELMNYYKQTNKGVLNPRMEESIRKLEEYGNNQLNVVLTRIREAFYTKFDRRLACHYIISGEKGQPYKIPLNPALVRWEECS